MQTKLLAYRAVLTNTSSDEQSVSSYVTEGLVLQQDRFPQNVHWCQRATLTCWTYMWSTTSRLSWYILLQLLHLKVAMPLPHCSQMVILVRNVSVPCDCPVWQAYTVRGVRQDLTLCILQQDKSMIVQQIAPPRD